MTFDQWWEGLQGTEHISATDRGYFLTQEAEWVSKDDMRDIFELISKVLVPKEQP